MNKVLSLLLLSAVMGLSNAAQAHEATPAPELRTISVSGDASVSVAPDQVTFTFGLQTRDKDLAEVKRLNTQRQEKLIKALSALGIASKDIRVDFLNLEPEYVDITPSLSSKDLLRSELEIQRLNRARRVLLEYVQKTTLVVVLHDVSKFEAVLTAALDSGVEYVHDINFQTSELKKYRTQARVLAMQSAKQKALALASELGQKVGKARSIQEGFGAYGASYGRNWSGRGGQQQSQMQVQAPANDGSDSEATPGNISIRAEVNVVFDLE